MKSLTLLAGALAIPAVIAYAQTTPPPTNGQAPYIPLFSSSGGPGDTGTGTSSTWFIDTTRNLVVMCTQSATGGGGAGAQPFTCMAQAVPTAPSGTPGAPGTPGGGTPPGGGAPGAPATGAPGANPTTGG